MVESLLSKAVFTSPVSLNGYLPVVLRRPESMRMPDEEEEELFISDGLPLDASIINQVHKEVLKDNPALFLEFSNLTENPLEIVKFANKNGLLGPGYNEPVILPKTEQMRGIEEGEGNSVNVWLKEIRYMKKAVDVWFTLLDLAGKLPDANADKLHPALPIDSEDQELKRQSQSDQQRLTIMSLVSDLRNNIAEHLSQEVDLEPVSSLSDAKGFINLKLRPSNLLSAMWLQFALAVEEGKDFRRCIECGAWMEVTPESRRKVARYCSNKCRSKAYRKRQEEARRLHEEGMSPAEIAEKLESTADTVKNWIK